MHGFAERGRVEPGAGEPSCGPRDERSHRMAPGREEAEPEVQASGFEIRRPQGPAAPSVEAEYIAWPGHTLYPI